MKLPPNLGVVRDLDAQLTKRSLEEFAEFAGGAERTFTGELFHLSDRATTRAFESLDRRGVAQRYLLDPEDLAEGRFARFEREGTELAPYAQMPAKVHSKGFVRDGEDAFITTGAFTDYTRQRYEFVLRFGGDAAAALEAATKAAMRGDLAAMRRADAHAAANGVLLNDAVAGSYHLTDALLHMADNAQQRIVVSTKLFGDRRLLEAVDRAAARGVPVYYTDIRAQGMHGNLFVADDLAYMGTAHFSPRSLGDRTRAYRLAREVGVLTDDRRQVDGVLDAMDGARMRVYDHAEFAEANRLMTRIDDAGRLEDRLDDLRRAGTPVPADDRARLERMREQADEAQAARAELAREVAARRDADGITFTNLPARTEWPAEPARGWASLSTPVRLGIAGGGVAATGGIGAAALAAGGEER